MFIWFFSIADSIINAVVSFFALIIMLWTFTMAGISQDETYKLQTQYLIDEGYINTNFTDKDIAKACHYYYNDFEKDLTDVCFWYL